ncbi:MAG: hypothetical protein ACM3UU_07690 [Ignavibacteriales bacterium]
MKFLNFLKSLFRKRPDRVELTFNIFDIPSERLTIRFLKYTLRSGHIQTASLLASLISRDSSLTVEEKILCFTAKGVNYLVKRDYDKALVAFGAAYAISQSHFRLKILQFIALTNIKEKNWKEAKWIMQHVGKVLHLKSQNLNEDDDKYRSLLFLQSECDQILSVYPNMPRRNNVPLARVNEFLPVWFTFKSAKYCFNFFNIPSNSKGINALKQLLKNSNFSEANSLASKLLKHHKLTREEKVLCLMAEGLNSLFYNQEEALMKLGSALALAQDDFRIKIFILSLLPLIHTGRIKEAKRLYDSLSRMITIEESINPTDSVLYLVSELSNIFSNHKDILVTREGIKNIQPPVPTSKFFQIQIAI